MTTRRPTRKWGKAGERLGPEGDQRRRQLVVGANASRARSRQHNREAYQRWRAGLVIPWRITMALDLRSLYGPDVDLACKAQEPDVDQWEAGERYPTWEQLVALADLTGFPPRFFVLDGAAPAPAWKSSMWFHMSAPERRAYEREYKAPVGRYPRAVLDSRPPSRSVMPDEPADALLVPVPPRDGPNGQGALFETGAPQ